MALYSTTQIAKLIGVHPNTIRFYEEMNLLPKIPRKENGYRVYNDWHLEQLRFLRTAFRAEIISNSLRAKVIEIVKLAAAYDIDGAYLNTLKYQSHLEEEERKAREAISITLDLLNNDELIDESIAFKGRKATSQLLGITTDVLRDWERNGLIMVPRNQKGDRIYHFKEIRRLKIIRTLRNAHYSMMSILRMLSRLDRGEQNLTNAIDTPGEEEDIMCATDRYLTALGKAKQDVAKMLSILSHMQTLG